MFHVEHSRRVGGRVGGMLRGTVPGGRGAKMCSVLMQTAMHTNDADEAAHRLAGKYAKHVIVNRTRKKDKTTLEWQRSEQQKPDEWPTVTKAQEALESIIGPFEVWRRTHVFSSADAAHFTDATDKERKLFLESWMGLGRFDGALGACRLELTQAQTRFEASQGKAQMLKAQLDTLHERVADAKKTLASLPTDPPAGGHETTLANLRHSIKATEQSLRELRKEHAGWAGGWAGSSPGGRAARDASRRCGRRQRRRRWRSRRRDSRLGSRSRTDDPDTDSRPGDPTPGLRVAHRSRARRMHVTPGDDRARVREREERGDVSRARYDRWSY